jgi:hypothetical protein
MPRGRIAYLVKVGSSGIFALGGLYYGFKSSAQKGAGKHRHADEVSHCQALGLLTPDDAQKTKVVTTKSFLTREEVSLVRAEIHSLQNSHNVGVLERDKDGQRTHSQTAVRKTSFLHTNGCFQERLPWLRERIYRKIFEVDAEHWNVMEKHDADSINFRTVECHEYIEGGMLSTEKHYDAGSLITVDIMLASPRAEFEGGALYAPTFYGEESTETVDLEEGDMALFVSHKYHNVKPVLSGRRQVLVAEVWVGPEKTCAHRCETLSLCNHSLTKSHIGGWREHVGLLG